MSKSKKIEIYKQIENFNSPVDYDCNEASSIDVKRTNTNIGDYLVIIDDEVFIRHWSDEADDLFVKPIYSSKFVRLNEGIIFQKQ